MKRLGMTTLAARKKSLKLVEDTIRLSQHVLETSPHQLASQLAGRLYSIDDTGVKELLENLKNNKAEPWLRPLTPCFTSPISALLRTLRLPNARVNAVDITPDGRLAVSGSTDKKVRIWDLIKGQELFALEGHKETVNCVAISSDGQTAVSGSGNRYGETSRDNTIRIWNLQERKEQKRIESFAGYDGSNSQYDAVNEVIFSSDDKQVIAISQTQLMVLNLVTGSIESTVDGHEFSHENQFSISPDAGFLVSIKSEYSPKRAYLRIGHIRENRETRLDVHSESLSCVAISPDGKKAVVGDDKGRIALWDLKEGKRLHSWAGHKSNVQKISITADGSRLISVSNDNKTAKVWDLKTGRELYAQSLASYLSQVKTTQNSQRALFCFLNGEILVWELDTGKTRKFDDHSSSVSDVAVTPDGRWLVSGSDDKTIKYWDLDAGSAAEQVRVHQREINVVSVSPDGTRVVTGGGDYTLRIWDLNIARQLQTFSGHKTTVRAAAYSPDGRFIVSCSGVHRSSPQDTTIRIWDAVSGSEVRCLKGHDKLVATVAVSPNGRYIVSGDWDGKLIIWDFKTGAEIRSFSMEHEISLEETWDELDEEDKEYLGDPQSDDPVQVHAAAFRDNGFCWILASYETPQILDLKQGLVQKSNLRLGNVDSPSVMAIPPGRQQIILGLTSGKIKVFDQNTGDMLFSLNGHTSEVNSIAVTKDGRNAASASKDGTVRVWDLSGPGELAVFAAEGEMRACGLTPDGRTLVAGGEAGRLYFLRREGGKNRQD